MIGLKTCPFCGGEAEFYRTPVKSNCRWCDSVVVRCKVCEARTNRILYDARKHQNDNEYDDAAEAWNNRKLGEETITNADRIRNMTDEELGLAMFNFMLNLASDPHYVMSPQGYTEWLQSPVEV